MSCASRSITTLAAANRLSARRLPAAAQRHVRAAAARSRRAPSCRSAASISTRCSVTKKNASSRRDNTVDSRRQRVADRATARPPHLPGLRVTRPPASRRPVTPSSRGAAAVWRATLAIGSPLDAAAPVDALTERPAPTSRWTAGTERRLPTSAHRRHSRKADRSLVKQRTDHLSTTQ